MDLHTWMATHDVIEQTLADAVGIHRGYLNRIRSGHVNVSLATALAIQDVTGGKVDLETLLPRHLQPWRPRPVLRVRRASRPSTPRKRPGRPTLRAPADA